jgi:hypothetical protein
MENQNKLNNNLVLALVLLGAVFFFIFVMPAIEFNRKKDLNKLKEGFNNKSDKEIRKLDKNMCSTQCCNHSQWPVPHDAKTGPIPKDKLNNYIGTNFSCNFGNGSGCLCVTKDDFNYLADRGGNSGSNMCK